jgi:acyl-CoA thioesterase-2
MAQTLTGLLECLALEEIDTDLFRGLSEAGRSARIFGGQVIAQSLVAATRSVEGRVVHSLHAYFLRPGDPTRPILFRVDRSREGRAFATRQVVALQGGEEILHLIASFQATEKGYEHQLPMPDVPEPEELTSLQEILEGARRVHSRVSDPSNGMPRAFDLRFARLPSFLGGESGTEPSLTWFRAPDRLADDADLHRSLLAYATDLTLNDNCVRVHGYGGPLGPPMTASLDHAVWFHADARVDEWLLFAMDSPRASAARGFNRGSIFRRDGLQIASVAQESLMRPFEPDAAAGARP